ncbi:hypothetical protein ACWD5Q_30370 [Streptomyces sp. NPDC002513]
MPRDLDPWQLLAPNAQEYSAFRIWATALEAAGTPVALLGSPDHQEDHYQQLYGLARGVLTVDAHVSICGEAWFVDHTTLRAPGGPRVTAAIRTAEETLRRDLASAALISPTGGLRITVTPQTESSPKERRRYFQRLVALGQQAAESGRPVYDPEAPDYDPRIPYPVAEPWPAPNPAEPVTITVSIPAHPMSWQLRNTPWGWGHNTDRIREILAAPITEKLAQYKRKNKEPGQLRRAYQLGLPTGLLIDARMGWRPPSLELPRQMAGKTSPPMIDIPVPLARDLLSELTAEHPDALSRAWLLSSDEQVYEIYNHSS